METILIVITKPRSTTHGKNSLVTLHLDSEKFDGPRTKITGSGVGQVTRDGVEYRSK